MRKFLSLVVLLVSGLVFSFGQGPVIEFERTEHDFGTIKEADGRVSTEFVFKNTGMAPLVLSNVRASCGCTTPNWPKEPIEPGKTGKITVTYNATGRPGHFQKTITVTSNASVETVRLFIKGDVTPKESSARAIYPFKVGDVSLKSQRIEYTSITQGVIAEKKVEMYNSSLNPVTVSIKSPSNAAITSDQVTIKGNEVGFVNMKVDTRKVGVGMFDIPLYLAVNDKEEKENLSLYLDIQKDFSKMSVEDLQKAPKIELASRHIDMGVVKPGGTISKVITVSNVGAANALTINQIYSANSNIKAEMVKTNVIKAGRNAEMRITVTAVENGSNQAAGEGYSKSLHIISDDPNNPKVFLTVEYKVEM